MPDPRAGDVTVLIERCRDGDGAARDDLFSLVYDELRSIARKNRFVGKAGETMQPTVLANEVYLLFDRRFPLPPPGERENRDTFFRTVALAMRMLLRDYWRKKTAKKCGGEDDGPIALGDLDPSDGSGSEIDFLALDEALDRLEKRNRRWFDIVMHKYFAGRTISEIAHLLDVSTTTVETDWKLAKAWLRRELDSDE